MKATLNRNVVLWAVLLLGFVPLVAAAQVEQARVRIDGMV
jgi:hypothetical protein